MCPQITFALIGTAPPSACTHASAYPDCSVLDNKFNYCILYLFLHTQTIAQKTVNEVSLQLIQQHYLAHLKLIRATFDNSHSSNGNHTTVYTSSLPNSHSGKDTTKQTSQVHSQAGSQARQHLGWQKTGVSKIGDGSPSSPGIN